MKKYVFYMFALSVLLMNKSVLATSDCGTQNGDELGTNCWECGDNCTARLDGKGKFTISGTGKMSDYPDIVHKNEITGEISYEHTIPWYNVHTQIKELEVQEGITGLGVYTFLACSNLTNLVLPESVESTGFGAFAWSGLENIELGDVSLDGRTFRYVPLITLTISDRTQFGSNEFFEVDFSSVTINCAGEIAVCEQNLTDAGYPKSAGYTLKQVPYKRKGKDGAIYSYNAQGKLSGISGKKIYTVEEAMEATKNGTRFHVGLTYK